MVMMEWTLEVKLKTYLENQIKSTREYYNKSTIKKYQNMLESMKESGEKSSFDLKNDS